MLAVMFVSILRAMLFNESFLAYKRMEMKSKGSRTDSIKGSSSASDSNYDQDIQNQHALTNLISEINKQTIVEGQGAKLDSIIRHIQYIKATDNGKCVVFSQWSKTLEMLQKGLSANGIKSTSINTSVALNKSRVAKFQQDPNVNVILLHARSQSSGLTLVQAQTVFIVEPVLNESLEKQAINRIHRIGQSKEVRNNY
jgi:E3 ubiquitin-protein ligase SHPRH